MLPGMGLDRKAHAGVDFRIGMTMRLHTDIEWWQILRKRRKLLCRSMLLS
jgi:hypothetical protein